MSAPTKATIKADLNSGASSEYRYPVADLSEVWTTRDRANTAADELSITITVRKYEVQDEGYEVSVGIAS